MAKPLVSRLLVPVVLLLLVGCDHASKGVAKAELEAAGARELISGLLSLRYVENTDIAFNLLRWIPETVRFPLLLVTGALLLVPLGCWLLRVRKKASLLVFALLLLTAGAVGNYLDRVLRGYVVDFVHVKHWPVFNVADVYLTVGLGVLAWALYAKRRGARPLEATPG